RLAADYASDTLSEADTDGAFGFAPGFQDHFVAVFEEASGFAVWKLDRPLFAPADLQEGAESFVVVGRQGASPDQVARLEIAAGGGGSGDDLRCAPVHCRRSGPT